MNSNKSNLVDKTVEMLTESVNSDYFSKYQNVIDTYMPDEGEGDTVASQMVTAVNKLIYKWYNDGDVYDNVNSNMSGWANDLASYANWLYEYGPSGVDTILKKIIGCGDDSAYEDILKALADQCLSEQVLDDLKGKEKQGTIYDCDGPFEFSEYDDEEGPWNEYDPDADDDNDEWEDYIIDLGEDSEEEE